MDTGAGYGIKTGIKKVPIHLQVIYLLVLKMPVIVYYDSYYYALFFSITVYDKTLQQYCI